MKLAEKGIAWAQSDVGRGYFNGIRDYPVDKKEAFKWLSLAAEQRHAPAINNLAVWYNSETKPDGLKEKQLRIEAANLGNSESQLYLTEMYRRDDENPKAIVYATLAYDTLQREKNCSYDRECLPQKDKDKSWVLGRIALLLGESFYYGDSGNAKSLYRAKHYFEVTIKEGNGNACYYLAVTLCQLSEAQYGGKAQGYPQSNVLVK